MKRSGYIVIVIIVILAAVAVLYIHFSAEANDPKQKVPKAESATDIRPLVVKKLQQLVKDGSDGLYNLSVEKLEPDITHSQLDLINATLIPDTSALQKLNGLKKAPDDVYKISLDSLHINGITINDVIHSDNIQLDSIFLYNPVVEVYHDPKPYNAEQRKEDSSITLYQKVMKQVKSVSVNSIIVNHATLISKQAEEKNKTKTYEDVNASFSHLLIDSTTQFDKNRFLFAKEAELSFKNYVARTPDSLYFFKVGSVSVVATNHTMIAKDVSLVPRGNKEEFVKKLPYRDDRYDIHTPKVVLNNVDWWKLANHENLFAAEADVYDCVIKDYIDRSLPPPSNVNFDNFPSQLLLGVPLKIDVGKINLHQWKVEYEEYNPQVKKSSGIYFDNLNGTLENLTNVKSSINKNAHVSFSGSAMFMSKVETKCKFQFDLSKPKTADCSFDLQMGALNKTILNPFAEPLGFFKVKSGEMKEGTVHLEGNIYTMRCEILMLYNDLHLTPLKPEGDSSGNLKKKSVTSFIANTFFIKNNNPSKGEAPRNIDVVVQRDHHDHFFNFLWKSLLTGLVKTIGVPEKYANKNEGK